MIIKFWQTILDYFKAKPYWTRIQPVFVLLTLYIVAELMAYQYIQWQYRISPSLSLYIGSYIFWQISLVFGVLGIVVFFINRGVIRNQVESVGRFAVMVRKHGKYLLRVLCIISIVLAIAAPIFVALTPNRVSHIRIKFMQEPDFDKYALVYIVYELNKLQKNWFFEIDYDGFDESLLTTKQRKRCSGDYKDLCLVEQLAEGQPLIGITTQSLGQDFFWQNRKSVSLISTFGWDQYAPPSVYEYLIHSIVVQSILIHLNAHCTGLPENAFKESRIAYGDLFQFSPRRAAMKSMILASHLNRKGEELLFNCFGVEYMSICSKLLSLQWLHTKRVMTNLKKSFDVDL